MPPFPLLLPVPAGAAQRRGWKGCLVWPDTDYCTELPVIAGDGVGNDPVIDDNNPYETCSARPDANHKTRNPTAHAQGMSNYLVAMEAAWLVRDVDDIDDAIGVAVSEAGKRLNDQDKEYVEVEVGATPCPACGEPFDSAFIAADTALVGLLLEIDVFNADSEEHASRIAKSEVGGALRDVPLSVIEVVETGEGDGDGGGTQTQNT